MDQRIVSTVFLFFWAQKFSNAQISHGKNAALLSYLNITDKFLSIKPTNRQEQEHICIFDCEFTIPFDQPLFIPGNCRQESTSHACEIEVRVELSLNYTVFSFWDTTIDLIIDDVRIDNFSAEIIGFEFDHNLLSYTLSYKCSYGNQCEWNYIQDNLPTIISKNYRPLFDSLSSLIYNDMPISNVSHCYSLDQLTDCQSGVCDFTQILDEESLTLTNIRECLVFDRPKIYFGHYQYRPGPVKYDFDYLYFACNINECNSPSNELAIKRLIGFVDEKNLAAIRTRCFNVIFIFYFLISVLMNMI